MVPSNVIGFPMPGGAIGPNVHMMVKAGINEVDIGKIHEGQQVRVELLDADEGSDVSLTPVMVVDGATVLATPDELKGASVSGRIVGRVKGPKINGYTFKRHKMLHTKAAGPCEKLLHLVSL